MSATLLLAAFGPAFYSLSRDIKLAAEIGLVSEKMKLSPKPAGMFLIVEPKVGEDGSVAGRLGLQIDLAAANQTPPGGPVSCETVRRILGDTTFAEIKKWNEDHGLELSAGQITTALIAAAAPLLASPVIDLSRYVSL